MSELIFIIDEEGTVDIEANGFKGTSCKKEVEDYEKALGGATKRKMKKTEASKNKVRS